MAGSSEPGHNRNHYKQGLSMKAYLLCLALVLASCATPRFVNPSLSQDQAVQQFPIDKGACLQAAYSIPTPSFNYAQAAPSSYQTYGNYNAYASGNSLNGSYSQNTYANPIPANSFAAGWANGMQIRAARDARQVQQAVFEGCMAQRGWQRQ